MKKLEKKQLRKIKGGICPDPPPPPPRWPEIPPH